MSTVSQQTSASIYSQTSVEAAAFQLTGTETLQVALGIQRSGGAQLKANEASLDQDHSELSSKLPVSSSMGLRFRKFAGICFAAGICSVIATSWAQSAPPAGPEQQGSGVVFTVLGAKVSGTIQTNEEPTGAGGAPWYSLAYTDAAWRAGELHETGTVPVQKAKLWRVPIRVDTSPKAGSHVVLKLYGDDVLKVYFDGFSLGTYEDAAANPKDVEIDITARLTPGPHLLAIRLNNRVGGSDFSCRILDLTPGSSDSFIQGHGFSNTMAHGTDLEKREAIRQARNAATAKPKSSLVRYWAVRSYLDGPPDTRDAVAAEREVAKARKDGAPIPWTDEVEVARRLGKLDQMLAILKQQATQPEKNPYAQKLVGDVLRDMGDTQGAASAYIAAMQPAAAKPEHFNVWNRILAAQKLLEIGQVEPVIKMMPTLVTAAKNSNYRHGILRLADIYRELGDWQSAEQLYIRAEQLDKVGGGTYRLARQLFETGKFNELLSITAAYDPRSSDTRYEVESWKIQALTELGRAGEAAKAAALFAGLSSSPDDEDFLLAYLQVARSLKANEQLKSAAQRLVGIYRVEASCSKYFRMPLQSQLEIMAAYDQVGMEPEAKAYAQAVLATASDAPLPKFQWARGRAARVLGQREVALRAFLNAERLASENYWVKKDCAALSSPAAGVIASAPAR
ncbi:MAG: hypothetical protein ACR2IE_16760 [Candidatus Sumerlaeaceae bacterium]